MIKIILICLAFVFGVFNAFAQGQTVQTGSTQSGAVGTGVTQNTLYTQQCSDLYTISGPEAVKLNTAYEYGISSKSGVTISPSGEFSILQNGEVENYKIDNERFVHIFSLTGSVDMGLALNQNTFNCTGTITKKISVLKDHILYIGSEKKGLLDASMNSLFREKSVLFETYFTSPTFSLEDSSSVWNALSSADIVVLNPTNIQSFFTEMEKLQRIKEVNFSKKKIFILSVSPRNFLSKVLASSVAKLGIENISIISEDQFNSLINKWAFNNDLTSVSGQPLSYEKNHILPTLNSFLEYLSYSGVSYQFLGFMLSLTVVALLFNILKQVIGLDTFSMYYPILFSVIFTQMGINFTLFFIGIAVISIVLVDWVTERYIQLLINAKKSFLISVYILFIFLFLGFDNLLGLNLIKYSIFDGPAAILAIFAILFMTERFYEGSFSFSRSGYYQLLQYTVLVLLASVVLTFKNLQYLLISYPDIIFILVLLNLAIGRYTGLQVVEYFRFSPILRNINEEE